MSDLSRSAKPNLEYKTYHNTGKKVIKTSQNNLDLPDNQPGGKVSTYIDKMAWAEKSVLELQIVEDISESLLIFSVVDLDTENEVSEGLEVVSDLSQKYRHVHVELRTLMGEEAYAEKYGDYAKRCETLREYVKSARLKLKNITKNEQDKRIQAELDEKKLADERILGLQLAEEAKTKMSLQIQEQVFGEKIQRGIANFELNDIAGIEKSCDKFEKILDEYYTLFSNVKIVFGEKFEDECTWKGNFLDNIQKLEEQIKLGKTTITKMNEEAQKIDLDNRSEHEKQTHADFLNEQRFNIEILSKELEMRCNALIKNCNTSELSNMTDYQVLECHKNRHVIDTELREIFDKFTSLSKVAALCPDRDEMLRKPRLDQKNALESRNVYAQKLHFMMTDRDISEEKLRTAATITVELSKFKGYESKLDIYSFKSEFERVIQKTVQKHLWVDTLKNNYLTGPAFTLVERTENMSEIWEKLVGAYGNVKLLLQNKISKLEKLESLDKVKGDEKLSVAISKIINMMSELKSLAEKHRLETKLYVGGGLEKVLSLIGEDRERKFISKYAEVPGMSPDLASDGASDDSLPEKRDWENLTKFLEKELAYREKLTLVQKSRNSLGIQSKSDSKTNDGGKSGRGGGSANSGILNANVGNIGSGSDSKCHLCGNSDHVRSTDRGGRTHIDYVACRKFVDASCSERVQMLINKHLCMQCLSPGVKFNDKHHCPNKFVCSHDSHKKYNQGMHVLLCDQHKARQENLFLLAEYMKNFILKRSDKFESFSKNISLVCYSGVFLARPPEKTDNNVLPDIPDRACFQLQTIKVEGLVKGHSISRKINMFFDGGCGDMVISKPTVDYLMSIGRAKLLKPGPVYLTGVSDHTSISEYGWYSVILPLSDGTEATLSGLCLDRVTADLPRFALKDVENDVIRMCQEQGGSALVNSLPKLPEEIGGETHILLGIKYKRYLPVDVWVSQTGLTLSESRFLSADGTTGVIGGPHPRFTQILSSMNVSIFALQVILYRAAYMEHSSVPILGEKFHETLDDIQDPPAGLIPSMVGNEQESMSGQVVVSYSESEDHESDSSESLPTDELCCLAQPPRNLKRFEEVENAGTEVSYRCGKCRNCLDCKRSSRLESVSIEEEVQQEVVERCVTVDEENQQVSHKLPFMTDPDGKLSSTDKLAMKIYESQVKTLSNKPEKKKAVIESEAKLQRLGYVEWFSNLDDEVKEMITSNFRYFIPWRVVENDNSLSTPCRLVFDASCAPKGGCSLNMLLAKGTNNMNKLISILIRWFAHRVGFHTDISKMYNVIVLDKKHWRYQMYLWDGELRVGVAPRWKTVRTAIYGVKSSGNVAECAVRKVAELSREEFPKAYDAINNDLYVDDCISGDSDLAATHDKADQFTAALSKGSFMVKGFTFSGTHPPADLTKDGVSILVGGVRWFSKDDLISINISKNSVTQRLISILSGQIPGKVTRKDCVSRVAGVFDPPGLLIPVTAGFKEDTNELCLRKLAWNDEIPEELRQIWRDNFEMIEELDSLQFKRAVIPEDAVDLNLETLDFADASHKLICVAIYVRFRLKSGGYSCQLVFSRSKIVPQDMSQPRAESLALEMNAKTGHVVKIAFGEKHQSCLKLSDSQVALHWANCTRNKLKLWVRNRVIETNRLIESKDLRYVDTKNMIADIGTRKGATLDDIRSDSVWINGFEWMKGSQSDFPVKTVEELVLEAGARQEAEKEKILIDSSYLVCHSVPNPVYLPIRYVPSSLRERYSFSKYLLDPNTFRFRKVVRVLALVLLYVHKLLKKINKSYHGISICSDQKVPDMMSYQGDQFLVTTGKNTDKNFSCKTGLIVEVPEIMINCALRYYYIKATNEIKQFVSANKYTDITVEKDSILYYSARVLPDQQFSGDLSLCDTSFDLSSSTFCVPMVDSLSPIAYAVANEVHWYHADVKHRGVESVLREVQCVCFIIDGRALVKSLRKACHKCRALEKKLIEVSMGPKPESALCIAPAFYNTQVDICGPYESYSNSNKRAKVKIWFVVFCCSTTGAVDCQVMEDYSTDSFVLAFICFACRYGYPCNLYPDYGSQLLKGCKDMVLSFSDIKHELHTEYGVQFEPCPVGGHNVHGKVERKIKEIKRSFQRNLTGHRLSVIQWETLGKQVANSINNLPIALGNKTECLENLDLITPNRLILGRNNNRSPTEPLVLSNDVKGIISTNADIFTVWFKAWLVSCVPSLIRQPKWFKTTENLRVGDVVLFLKNENELESHYQYGMVSKLHTGADGLTRAVDVDYQNHNEKVKRRTKRSVRNLVVIHHIDEVGVSQELYELCEQSE